MTWRYRCVLLFIIFGFFLVIARLFYWQIVKAEELSDLGQSQYTHSLKLTPQRGIIKSSDGFPIATNTLSYIVYANPKVIAKKDHTAKLLSPLLEIDEASISAKLDKDLFWVSLKLNVDSKEKESIEKLKIEGIGFEQEYVRFYPEASLAANLIGFVGKNDVGENKGYFGLEGFYDRLLRGKEGIALVVRDALGRPIVSKINNNSPEIPGRSLELSIDRAIQFMVERKLKEAVEKYQASGGMVGIIEPKTGNILSLASYPSFDNRNFIEYDPVLYKNPFITNVYEPGSTFKALVMASAIDSKVVKPETKCPICSKEVEIANYAIRTWNNKYYENTTMIAVIQHSDNTGMVYAGQKLGLDRMLEYFDKFGIGKLTGIDLQGEVLPQIRAKEDWYPIDLATASFGQGINITPIELLVGFSSLANEGKRMEPHIVRKIENEDGSLVEIKPKLLSKPVSSSTAKVMTEILVNAVNKGESKFAKPKGYRVAGKTGTAQIPIDGHYDPNKTIASFIGFAPADDPKFAMLVIIDRPTTSIYGSETAAPLFFNIAKDMFAYYGILPTESE